MKKLFRAPAVLALATALLSSCSITPEPASPKSVVQTANSVPCETCPPVDPPSGGDGGECVAPTQSIKDRIRAYVVKNVPLMHWTRVTTITPPDGITYGLGCSGVYMFSVDIIDEYGRSTYASGTYDSGTGQYTLTK